MWLSIAILALICAAIGGYIYLAEYRSYGGALEPAPADHGEETMQTDERLQ